MEVQVIPLSTRRLILRVTADNVLRVERDLFLSVYGRSSASLLKLSTKFTFL